MDFEGIYQDVLVNGEMVHEGRECDERLAAIMPHVKKGAKVLDIGSHSGYFAIELARKKKAKVMSIENYPLCVETQRWAIEQNNVGHLVELVDKEVTMRNVSSFTRKKFDVVLLLAVIQYFDIPVFLDRIKNKGDKFIIEFATPDETEAIYHDKVMAVQPFDKFLERYFSKVELIAEPVSPNSDKSVKRVMYLCEK